MLYKSTLYSGCSNVDVGRKTTYYGSIIHIGIRRLIEEK